MTFEVSHMTRVDYEEWFKEPPRATMRGTVVRRDGEIVALGGIVYDEGGSPRAWMEWRDDATPRELIKGVRHGRKTLLREYKIAYAVAQDPEKSDTFLRHFGFEQIGTHKIGGIYRWLAQQQYSQ